MDCNPKYKHLIPLHNVVSAAIIDVYEDIGKTQQLFFHWSARGLRKLMGETLKKGKREALLTVNKNTHTATLPPDFGGEFFVGIIDECGHKIALRLRTSITNTRDIVDVPCEDLCPKCNQNKAICEELQITETTNLKIINTLPYNETVIKKLYPDGSYYLETTTPVRNVETEGVDYVTTKEFITAFSLKPCGCLETSDENVEKIKTCCPDVYYCHYAPCDNSCVSDYGSYKIFEEAGLIAFDSPRFDKVYIEYKGFMPKVNGEYQVPEVAFETLVEYVKFKSVQNKKSVPLRERDWYFGNYQRERRNMEKILGAISLSQIIQAIGLTPKFDVARPWYSCLPKQALAEAIDYGVIQDSRRSGLTITEDGEHEITEDGEHISYQAL